MMNEQEIKELAEAIANNLHASVLKIPAEVANALKPYSGWQTRTMICGGDWPVSIDTKIMSDGGIHLKLTSADGILWMDRVLSP